MAPVHTYEKWVNTYHVSVSYRWRRPWGDKAYWRRIPAYWDKNIDWRLLAGLDVEALDLFGFLVTEHYAVWFLNRQGWYLASRTPDYSTIHHPAVYRANAIQAAAWGSIAKKAWDEQVYNGTQLIFRRIGY